MEYNEVIAGLGSADPMTRLSTLQRMGKDDYVRDFRTVRELTKILAEETDKLLKPETTVDGNSFQRKACELAATRLGDFAALFAANNHSDETKAVVDLMGSLFGRERICALPAELKDALSQTSAKLNKEMLEQFQVARKTAPLR